MKSRVSGTVLALVVLGSLAGSMACGAIGRTGAGESSPTETGEAGARLTDSPGEVGAVEASLPEIDVQARIELGYPWVPAGGGNRSMGANIASWPEMLYLGDEAQVNDVGVRPVEVRIVAGGSVPMAYSPELDEIAAAPEGSPLWIRRQSNRPGLVIPPNASVVMVRIETMPSVGRWTAPGVYDCPMGYGPWPSVAFTIAYPRLGETRRQGIGNEWWFGEYQSVGYGCPGSGWLYFVLPGVDLDPALLWLENIWGTEAGEMVFWTLTARP